MRIRGGWWWPIGWYLNLRHILVFPGLHMIIVLFIIFRYSLRGSVSSVATPSSRKTGSIHFWISISDLRETISWKILCSMFFRRNPIWLHADGATIDDGSGDADTRWMVEPGDADTRWMMMANRVISELTSYTCVPIFFCKLTAKVRFRPYLLF